ncbi:hypothetical protein [Candidatus Stoquefichus sp. SB1]|jgi:cell division protein FtsL|uniref:hypothetical protein n=1 Tax=Candidatus Stoquefichus sp. SB1 TaxID=1658109 RepID=UPI00067F4A04|nr:hypothetical protein [Candidatus Stoquefichus sp. SB1]
MKRSKKKETRFVRFSRRLLIFSFFIFVVGIVALNSYESTLNINCQNLEKEIATIESDIDGLDIKQLELAALPRIEAIAKKKGYTYEPNKSTAAIVGVPRE